MAGYERQQIVSPGAGADGQASNLRQATGTFPALAHRGALTSTDPVGGVAAIDETKLILLAACSLGLLGCYLLFRCINRRDPLVTDMIG